MKRFFLEFDVTHPELSPGIGGWYNHLIGTYDKHHIGGSCYCSNSLKTMKVYINRIRKDYAELEPHDFRIYDHEAPDEPNGHVGCVYHEQ